jgi:hypothetical protein
MINLIISILKFAIHSHVNYKRFHPFKRLMNSENICDVEIKCHTN